jgi:CxxC motif-containing protein (DUF1111 family)
MTKAHFGYKLSTSIVAMMLSVTAAQNALAQSREHGHGHGNHDPGNNQSSGAVDPGVRGGPAGAGGPVAGLTAAQTAFFNAAQARFTVVETVPAGLGPGFNELSCAACHIQPAIGGSSPTTNPQVTDGVALGATNVIPSFITANGPIREARFVLNPDGTPDGGVHDLFSIQGRSDAPGCVFAQPNFSAALANNNVIFRIPIQTFGDGLIEGVSDLTLTTAFQAQTQQNGSLGISGQFNLTGNTGNITRFGWKAQNASMLMFAGEAYNVEEGVTNQLFPEERNFVQPAPGEPVANAQCAPNPEPEDTINTVDTINSESTVSDNNPDITNFALYMSLLAPPAPAVPLSTLTGAASSAASTSSTASSSTSTSSSTAATVQMASVMTTAAATTTSASTTASSAATPSTASLAAGLQAFQNVGCSGCHTMNLTTGTNLALIDTTTNPNISNITINPFSDYAVHTMGTGLADGVSQGNANGSQFRSAPLWGIGQRVFFLHDGRTNNLLTAIEDHASSGSEANAVIAQFNLLSTTDQQNILNFLRNL